MTPSTLLFIGISSLIVGAICAFANFSTAAKRHRSITSVMVCHGITALFWFGGAITILVSIIMFLINYAKS